MRLSWLILSGALALACHAAGPERPDFPFIDAHAHILEPTPAFYDFIGQWNVRVLDLAAVDPYAPAFRDAARQHAWELKVFP